MQISDMDLLEQDRKEMSPNKSHFIQPYETSLQSIKKEINVMCDETSIEVSKPLTITAADSSTTITCLDIINKPDAFPPSTYRDAVAVWGTSSGIVVTSNNNTGIITDARSLTHISIYDEIAKLKETICSLEKEKFDIKNERDNLKLQLNEVIAENTIHKNLISILQLSNKVGVIKQQVESQASSSIPRSGRGMFTIDEPPFVTVEKKEKEHSPLTLIDNPSVGMNRLGGNWS